MIEHRLIEREISLLGREYDDIVSSGEVDVVFLEEGIDFLRSYADKVHHGKEEDILFRDLEKRDITPTLRSTMDGLREDHRRSREHTRALLDAVMGYRDGDLPRVEEIKQHLSFLIALYPQHIETEDRRFFIPCMEYFSDREKEEMLKEFSDFDGRMIHEHYRTLVEKREGKNQSRIILSNGEDADG